MVITISPEQIAAWPGRSQRETCREILRMVRPVGAKDWVLDPHAAQNTIHDVFSSCKSDYGLLDVESSIIAASVILMIEYNLSKHDLIMLLRDCQTLTLSPGAERVLVTVLNRYHRHIKDIME